ncbi:hypothetical protein CerSpe_155770 [Prunus speciosa]
MIKEIKTEAVVKVGIEALWKALVKDVRFVAPKLIPLVKNIQVLEGDGGPVLLSNFGSGEQFALTTSLNFLPHIPKISSSKEKIVELDESVHKIELQVIEGGHLNLGFSSYKTTLQLTAIREQRSLVNKTGRSWSSTGGGVVGDGQRWLANARWRRVTCGGWSMMGGDEWWLAEMVTRGGHVALCD